MNNAARRRARLYPATAAAEANAAAAAKAIADRKVEAARLIAKLQGLIAKVPADGNWAQAGDLGHYIEQLECLVGERG